MGTDFFPERGKNALKIVTPPNMATGEGILFALLGEGKRGGKGGQPNFCKKY